ASSDSAISSVTWKNDLGGNGAADGTAAWQANNIPLTVGSNTITVTASDADGDFSTDVLIVNRQSSDPDPVTLSWTAPTEREDGSALTSLAGYKLYYGRMSEIYDYEIEIDNPGLQTYVVENLEPGEWYFVVTALDAEGLESDHSNEALEQVM
ncbi:MAG: fibronectin type III domain-containing protein, partial [Woeseia sp.]